jgi:hypothetical protein
MEMCCQLHAWLDEWGTENSCHYWDLTSDPLIMQPVITLPALLFQLWITDSIVK